MNWRDNKKKALSTRKKKREKNDLKRKETQRVFCYISKKKAIIAAQQDQ